MYINIYVCRCVNIYTYELKMSLFAFENLLGLTKSEALFITTILINWKLLFFKDVSQSLTFNEFNSNMKLFHSGFTTTSRRRADVHDYLKRACHNQRSLHLIPAKSRYFPLYVANDMHNSDDSFDKWACRAYY